jgi:hypothetical protein
MSMANHWLVALLWCTSPVLYFLYLYFPRLYVPSITVTIDWLSDPIDDGHFIHRCKKKCHQRKVIANKGRMLVSSIWRLPLQSARLYFRTVNIWMLRRSVVRNGDTQVNADIKFGWHGLHCRNSDIRCSAFVLRCWLVSVTYFNISLLFGLSSPFFGERGLEQLGTLPTVVQCSTCCLPVTAGAQVDVSLRHHWPVPLLDRRSISSRMCVRLSRTLVRR